MASGEESNLVDFVVSMGGEKSLRVEENFLLRNSRDAGARHIYVATYRDGDTRYLTMLDDGSGIPESMQDRVFDARVTSKLESVHMDRWGVHGRGMALFSVRENAQEARVVSSAPEKGASIQVVTDATKLRERADQSTWPSVGVDEDGNQAVTRGPHNIVRTCCEFALEERGRCEVFVGSPAEICATARRRVTPTVEGSALLFIDSLEELPVLERLRAAADASELFSQATSLGLDMSERTALLHKSGGEAREVDLAKDRRGLQVSADDVDEFSRIMERGFSFLSDRYYLTLASDPKVRVTRGKVTVTFDIDEEGE